MIKSPRHDEFLSTSVFVERCNCMQGSLADVLDHSSVLSHSCSGVIDAWLLCLRRDALPPGRHMFMQPVGSH